MSSTPSASKIKRKPPPAFPYSPRFPEPDPNDPFLPLSVLRARAQTSSSTLNNPSSTDSHGSHQYGADARKTHYLLTPDKTLTESPTAEQPSQRPWHGLAGYLSDVSKPLRPPRSRKRPSTNARDTTYFSDVDIQPHIYSQPQSQLRQQRTAATSDAAQPAARRTSVQNNRDSQYHYRRRSQSVLLPSSRRTSVVAPALGPKPNASESAQYALSYGDRQSHGYSYVGAEDDRHEDQDAETTTAAESTRSRMQSDASTQSDAMSSAPSVPSRHPTPPMTPDDTLSSMSTSPLQEHSFAAQQAPSFSPPSLLQDLPELLREEPQVKPMPVPKDDVVLRPNRDTIVAYDANRDTIVAETPATGQRQIQSSDFSILLPPVTVTVRPPSSSTADPTPVREEPPLPQTTAPTPNAHVRYVESDSETNVRERRRSRAGSLSEFRKRLQKSANTTSGIRGKVISSPIPIPKAAARKPSNASDSSVSAAHAAAVEVPPVPRQKTQVPPSAFSDSEAAPGNRQSRLGVPKPKKSLSHVNLGLKVLPNASLAPTVAPSANTSNASALYGNSPRIPREEGLETHVEVHRSQTELVVPRVEREREVQRAHTVIPRMPEGTVRTVYIPAPLEYESDEELDLAAYSILTNFTLALSPIIPLASSTPVGIARIEELDDVPCVPSPDFIEEELPEPEIEPEPVVVSQHGHGHGRRSMPLPAPPPRAAESVLRASTAPPQRAADPVLRASTAPPQRVVDPVLRTSTAPPRTESPIPRVSSPAPKTSSQRVESPPPIPPVRYRSPAPLPLEPPPRAKSPIGAQLHSQQFQAQVEAEQPVGPPPRALSPVPVPLKSKAVQDVLQKSQRDDDERSSQRSRGSRASREREDTGYLPVAQLPRPTVSRQQTAQSLSSSRRARGSGTQVAVTVATPVAQLQPTPARGGPRPQSPPHAPRARSPEPVRVPVKVRPPPKDVDSPLPPPPVEVTATATVRPSLPSAPAPLPPPPPPSEPRQMRLLGGPSRAVTMPEVSSPMIFVTPPELLSPEPPRRVFTEPFAMTDVESHSYSHPDYMDEHGRACVHASTQANTSRRAYTLPPPDFHSDLIPTSEQLARAATIDVIAQNGLRVPFGDLFRDRKVVVVFIRHFWCPLCQDYMQTVSRRVDIEALKRAGVSLVVIGNGSPAMIKAYRHIFHTPFAVYTDPSLRVYNALGMTHRTTDPGPDSEKGEYVRHGLIGGIAMVVRNALRVGMPVWERGGDVPQLGGEFVLGPGLACSFAHRMKNTRDHAPILDVLAAAGVHRHAPRSQTMQEVEDTWPSRYQTLTSHTSHEHSYAKREKRRDCLECGMPEVPYDDHSEHGMGAAGSWEESRSIGVTRDEGAEADTEEDRDRVPRRLQSRARTRSSTTKKSARSYRVANPDRRRRPAPRSYEKHDPWNPPASADEFGRTYANDAAYMLTHEVVSHSFGIN